MTEMYSYVDCKIITLRFCYSDNWLVILIDESMIDVYSYVRMVGAKFAVCWNPILRDVITITSLCFTKTSKL